ncbi:MAG: GCN5 family acetyltransferase [Chloroflexota bacterium]|nr:MAG: GCN5 family acetyltransferase [Chloroflexota bacterium]
MKPLIRPFREDDYPAIAAVTQATLPDNEYASADQFRYGDERRDPAMKFARWMAEIGGRVVGLSYYTQYADLYDPRMFWVMVRVIPEFQRQGIGTALYETLLAGVCRFDPLALRVSIREDQTAALAFARRRGFAEYHRRHESWLEVAAADLSGLNALETRLEHEGIRVRSVAELADDPQRDMKLYDLQWALDQDIPIGEPITRMAFETFRKSMLEHPDYLADGTFVALDGERYIGLSSFYRSGPHELHIDLTGTLPEYRGRGIATLLKMRGVRFARATGYARIVAMNDPSNGPMLAINQKLGYVRRPAQIRLQKVFQGGQPCAS